MMQFPPHIILDHLETAEGHGGPLNDSSTCCLTTVLQMLKMRIKKPTLYLPHSTRVLALRCLVCTFINSVSLLPFVIQLVLWTTWKLRLLAAHGPPESSDYWLPMDHTLLWYMVQTIVSYSRRCYSTAYVCVQNWEIHTIIQLKHHKAR
jgi:hypothetical protein